MGERSDQAVETAKHLNQKMSSDFSFVLRQTSVLKNAVAALGEPTFNQRQLAVIQVGQGGFELTVQIIDSMTKKQVFGFLRFKSTGLKDFRCSNPLRKMVSLTSLYQLLKDSEQYGDDSVAIFVGHGSSELSFQWGEETSCKKFDVDLLEVDPEYKTFPNLSYGFEAVIPSKMLTDAITEVLAMEPQSRPTNAMVTLKAATVIIELDDDLVLSTENKSEKHEVSMDWQYWESLQKASCLSGKCSMYLVIDPPEHIMFHFSLRELGDLVYLTQANFLDVSELPELDNFRSLLNMRSYRT